MPTYLRKLNVSRRDAALLLIVAGPRSGKTSTMVARILTLLNEGVDSKNNDLHNSCCNGDDGPRRCCGGGGVQGTYDLDVSFLLFATLSLSCGECTATSFFHTALAECHNTWAYVLVDEFQDTSVMQYKLLRLLSLHGRVTVVGSDITSFNGGFSTFRNDVPNYKEVRPQQNYRSTGCIVEATVVMECRNEEAQCTFVVDEILEMPVTSSRCLQTLLYSTGNSRKIPFNMHGVAVYCKKVVKDVIALLWTSLGRSGTVFERRVFKALYRGDKTEKRKAVKYVAKNEICSFLEAAEIIFTAKVSGANLAKAVKIRFYDELHFEPGTIFVEPSDRCIEYAISENGRRAKLAEARAKAEAEERQRQLREQAEAEANKALEEAKDAAALANELEEEGKELAKQEAQAVANPQKAKDKAKAAAASLEVLGAKMKDIGASISETSQNGLGGFFKRGTVAAEKEEESQEEEEEVKAKFGLGNLFKRSKATVSSAETPSQAKKVPSTKTKTPIAAAATGEEVLIDALVGVGGRRRSASQEQLKHQQHQQVQEYAALLQSCVDGGNLLHRSIVAKDLEQHVSLWNCLVNMPHAQRGFLAVCGDKIPHTMLGKNLGHWLQRGFAAVVCQIQNDHMVPGFPIPDATPMPLVVSRNFFVANGDGLPKGVVDNAAENS
ncbi:hypothetical protein SELMODRAFT_409873 [Selaginella moellendorffii]|uniref:UvrD-like helicase ATP-binding domain-containing protein n=1 Tax=Selaginella moellendorffii TaxID=88036 RepID=D8RCR3_SELML|nr:hypothetical protein SELMODRAFT_409873 [Selaginella moellendorffii]